MSRMKKIVGCLLFVSLLAGISAVSGCNNISSAEVVASVMNAYATVETYVVDTRMTAVETVTGGDRPGTRTYAENMTGKVNTGLRQFEFQSMHLGSLMPDWITQSRRYLYNEIVYIKTETLDHPDPDHDIWVKLRLDDEDINRDDRLWTNGHILGQQIGLLNAATEVTVIGTEKIEGAEAYVLAIDPDWDMLADWLAGEPPWSGPRFLDFPDRVESLSLRMWVDTGTGRLLKTRIRIEYTEIPYSDAETIVNLEGEITFTGYNAPFEVVLPEETKDAVLGPIS